jgi:nucleoside-diphosphate-sugar epimerase
LTAQIGRVFVGLKGDIIMRIFVTGAPGFIGSALVPELIQAGHQVLGLTRSEAGAEALRAAGAEVKHGNIEDLDSLRDGAAKSDGVIHLAFNHDFSQFQKNCEDDRKAIEAIGEVLLGSNRPFVVTSGTAIRGQCGRQAIDGGRPDRFVEPARGFGSGVKELTARGVNTSVVRLPQVHDTRKQGLVPYVTPWRARSVCRPTSAMAAIAGRRRTFPTWRGCTVWRLRRRSRARSTTRSTRRACR